MLSWSAFTRAAGRLPSSTSASMRLRRAESTAISPPEKNPFPSRRTKIEAAMKRGSDMAGAAMLPKEAPRPRPCSGRGPLIA